jgi:hypothetical protein
VGFEEFEGGHGGDGVVVGIGEQSQEHGKIPGDLVEG